jgi:hypothetical protein
MDANWKIVNGPTASPHGFQATLEKDGVKRVIAMNINHPDIGKAVGDVMVRMFEEGDNAIKSLVANPNPSDVRVEHPFIQAQQGKSTPSNPPTEDEES